MSTFDVVLVALMVMLEDEKLGTRQSAEHDASVATVVEQVVVEMKVVMGAAAVVAVAVVMRTVWGWRWRWRWSRRW